MVRFDPNYSRTAPCCETRRAQAHR
jgi:hypothetical protein